MISFEYPHQGVIGGIGTSARRIATNLAGMGYEVHVITKSKVAQEYNISEALKAEVMQDQGVTIHKLSPSSDLLVHMPPQELSNAFEYLIDLHKKIDFDIFQGMRLYPSGYLAVVMGKVTGKPSLACIRGNEISLDLFNYRLAPVTIWTLKEATEVTSVAKDLLDDARRIADLGGKGIVLHNSIETRRYLYDARIRVERPGHKIGLVGFQRQKKGYAYALEALSRVKEKDNCSLIIIGDIKDDEKEYFWNYATRLGIRKNIAITGPVKEEHILNYIKKMDFAVFPAMNEGCPNTLLQAMYTRTPVIVTDVGAQKDLIQDGVNGLIVPRRDTQKLTEAMERLIKDKTLAKKLAKNAFETIKTGHLIEHEMNQWCKIYDCLLR